MLENYQNTPNRRKLLKYPWNLLNNKNGLKNYMMIKIHPKPKDDRNTLKPKNDQNTPKWPKYSFL